MSNRIAGLLLPVLLMALPTCYPVDSPGPVIEFGNLRDSLITIDLSYPDAQAFLLARGDIHFSRSISDLEFGQVLVRLSAEEEQVAERLCYAEFIDPPLGDQGYVAYRIDCEFLNSEAGPLCTAESASIEVDMETTYGGYRRQSQPLAVECLEDRRVPELLELLDLVSEGNPSNKPCMIDDVFRFEHRLGYQSGLIVFEDVYDVWYQHEDYVGRLVFLRDADGKVVEKIDLNPEGLWNKWWIYDYEDEVVSGYTYLRPDLDQVECTYIFAENDTQWTEDCEGHLETATWDPENKVLVWDLNSTVMTTTYSGTLESPTQWYTQPHAGFINTMHPIEERCELNGQELIDTFVYDVEGRLIRITGLIGGEPGAGGVEYEYNCQ